MPVASWASASVSGRRGNPCQAASVGFPTLHDRVRNIIPVPHTLFVRVAWTHPIAAIVEDAAHQNRRRALEPILPRDRIGGELGLYGFEERAIQDRFMLSPVYFATVNDLADQETVLEQLGQRSDPERNISSDLAST
jgi:hypothetical protein